MMIINFINYSPDPGSGEVHSGVRVTLCSSEYRPPRNRALHLMLH